MHTPFEVEHEEAVPSAGPGLVDLDLGRADTRDIARTYTQSAPHSVILRSAATKNLECGNF